MKKEKLGTALPGKKIAVKAMKNPVMILKKSYVY